MESGRLEVGYIYGESRTIKHPHQHNNRCFPFVVVVFVIKGRYICLHDGSITVADEGETLVVPEYILHNVEMKESGELSWAHITAHVDGNDILSGITAPFVIDRNHSSDIMTAVDGLVTVENRAGMLGVLYEHMYISKIFVTIASNADAGDISEPVWLTDIKKYINDNITAYFTIGELASLCCMSESTFSHKFKQETGVSPIKYVLMQKVNKSLPMLNGHQTLKSISESLNFTNEYYYSKQFKKITGMTPSQYVKEKNIT